MAESRNSKKKRTPAVTDTPESEVSLDAIAAAVAADAPVEGDDRPAENTANAEPEVAPEAPSIPEPTHSQSEDTIMADTHNTETEKLAQNTADFAAEAQERMKAAYGKGTELTSEAVEFGKGNVEAFVESSRILVSGLQDLGRTYADEARSAAETMQDDLRKLTAAKSPTELLQLQGEIARRNFDAMVATASRSTEAMIKLANEAFAPVSNRMSLAADKVSRAA